MKSISNSELNIPVNDKPHHRISSPKEGGGSSQALPTSAVVVIPVVMGALASAFVTKKAPSAIRFTAKLRAHTLESFRLVSGDFVGGHYSSVVRYRNLEQVAARARQMESKAKEIESFAFGYKFKTPEESVARLKEIQSAEAPFENLFNKHMPTLAALLVTAVVKSVLEPDNNLKKDSFHEKLNQSTAELKIEAGQVYDLHEQLRSEKNVKVERKLQEVEEALALLPASDQELLRKEIKEFLLGIKERENELEQEMEKIVKNHGAIEQLSVSENAEFKNVCVMLAEPIFQFSFALILGKIPQAKYIS